MTDEQIAQKVSALKREKRGYVQRHKAAKKISDQEAADRLSKRIDAIDKEIARLSPEPVEVCDECGFEAKNAKGLAVHVRSHDDDDTDEGDEDE